MWWMHTLLIQTAVLTLSFVAPVRYHLTIMWLPEDAGGYALAAVLVLSVMLRTRAPWIAFAAMAVSAQVFAFDVRPPFSLFGLLLAYIIAGYAAFSTVSLRTAVIIAASIDAVFIATFWFARGENPLHIFPLINTTTLAIGLLAGQMSSARRRLIDTANRRAVEAEQTREALAATKVAEHRLATARDLHDAIGHQVALINLHARAASHTMTEAPDQARRSLDIIERSAGQMLGQIAELLRDLRGDEAPTSNERRRISEVFVLTNALRAGGLHVEMLVDAGLPTLPPDVDDAAYRILEEGLVNAYKYGAWGEAATARLEWKDQELVIGVSNFIDETRRTPPSTGLGITGMRERAEALGGVVLVSAGGSSFELEARLPVGAA